MNVENYEHNMRIVYESMRKDLDIILTSTIPTQKSLMKTLLWLNLTIIGFVLSQYNKLEYQILLSPSFAFSFSATIAILISLMDGRIKYFGSPQIELIQNIPSNEWEKTNGIIKTIEALYYATEQNKNIVVKRANKIAFATKLTIISVISIGVYVIIIFNLN